MRGPVRKEGPWCGGYLRYCDMRASTRILILKVPDVRGPPVEVLRDWPLCESCMIATHHMERSEDRLIFEVQVGWAGDPTVLVSVHEVMSW